MKPSLKARAIALLSRREHSRVELRRKLAPHSDDPAELERTLDELERANLLSSERFAESLLHRKAQRHGSRRIVQELRGHDLPEDTISRMQASLQASEYERAREVWVRKFGAAPADAKEYARQFRFLANRGFPPDCLRRILAEMGDSSNDESAFFESDY